MNVGELENLPEYPLSDGHSAAAASNTKRLSSDFKMMVKRGEEHNEEDPAIARQLAEKFEAEHKIFAELNLQVKVDSDTQEAETLKQITLKFKEIQNTNVDIFDFLDNEAPALDIFLSKKLIELKKHRKGIEANLFFCDAETRGQIKQQLDSLEPLITCMQAFATNLFFKTNADRLEVEQRQGMRRLKYSYLLYKYLIHIRQHLVQINEACIKIKNFFLSDDIRKVFHKDSYWIVKEAILDPMMFYQKVFNELLELIRLFDGEFFELCDEFSLDKLLLKNFTFMFLENPCAPSEKHQAEMTMITACRAYQNHIQDFLKAERLKLVTDLEKAPGIQKASIDTIIKLFDEKIQEILVKFLREEDKPYQTWGDFYCIHHALAEKIRNIVFCFNQFVKNICDANLANQKKEITDELVRQTLEQCKAITETQLTATARDRKIAKELERKKRLAAQEKIAKETEEKTKKEKDEAAQNISKEAMRKKAKLLWDKIAILDEPEVVLLQRILGGNEHRTLKENEVNKLARKLELLNDTAQGGMIKIGDAFTSYHTGHGKDRSDKLDGEYIAGFKKILALYGINRDNLLQYCAKKETEKAITIKQNKDSMANSAMLVQYAMNQQQLPEDAAQQKKKFVLEKIKKLANDKDLFLQITGSNRKHKTLSEHKVRDLAKSLGCLIQGAKIQLEGKIVVFTNDPKDTAKPCGFIAGFKKLLDIFDIKKDNFVEAFADIEKVVNTSTTAAAK